MPESSKAAVSTSNRRIWLPILGYAISIACLWWVYKDFNWQKEWPAIRATPWYLILAAIACDIAVYCVQGWRWNEVLRPVGYLPVWRTMQAIYVGLFANEVAALRPGELIRALLQARWSGVSLTVVLSSVLIERIFDGVWLILAFFLASWYVSLPTFLVFASRFLAGLVLLLGVVLWFAIYRRPLVDRVLRGSIWAGGFARLLDALQTMGRSPSFWRSFLLSLPYLLLQIGPIYFLQLGYGAHQSGGGQGLNLSLAQCAVILVVLRLGTVPPQAPGNAGGFQAFLKMGLALFGIAEQQATGFITLLFIVITGPLWLVGFLALLATRMKLSQLRLEAETESSAAEAAASSAGPLR